ncbi:hypothetical protein PVL29_025864 [Vitis rotundifolia]|uniref:Inner centromere protein ARK-binding domain-containing protein n=1 Tax=Vitis rotundifolia TaxID=103349 RepID=A0AA39D724_VITRO|nr:hypothetical protein PVL29_025864 [Vitis rotundifolia]
MSTVEKLFVQIFERKNRIIEQVKHQTDAFDRHLASNLIIEGFNPPPWLLTPSFEISSSDPKELKKEELISGLLLPHPQPTMVPYYNGHYSLYNKSAITVNTGEFSDGLPMETHASNKGFDAGERQTAVPQCNNNETEIPVSGVLEPGPSATSSPNQIDARISNIYSKPDQSLARIQRSKSRQKALEFRNSSKVKCKNCLVDDNNNGTYSSGVAVSRMAFRQSNLVNELLESVKPSNINNENNGEREAEKGDHYSLEKGGNIYSGRVTRSRSSSQQIKCVNMDGSSHVTKGDSVRLAPSIGKPMHQSAYASALLDPSNIDDKSHALIEDKMGDPHSKGKGSYVYSGRITRSRSSSEKVNSVDVSSKLDSSSNIAREDRGTQAASIPNSLQSPNHANEFLELVKPFDIKGRSREVKEVTKVDIQSKEKGSGVYCGRITRSRSSYQRPNCLGGFSELVSSSNIVNEDGCKLTQPISKLMEPSEPLRSTEGDAASQNAGGTQISLRRSSPRQKDSELPAEDAREHPGKGNVADECVGRRTRSTSFASGRSALGNTLNRSEGLELLGTNILPCAETNNIAKQERCAATAPETELVSDEPVDSHLVCSGSNLDGASLRVGLEVLVSRPPSDLDMFVKPKQLDFDDVEDCSLNEASGPAPMKKRQDTSSSGMRCSTPLAPAESLVRVISNNHHGNSVPPLKLLKELEVLSKEEEARTGLSESDAEEKVEVEKQKLGYGFCHAFSTSRTSNRSAGSSINKAVEVYETAISHTLPEGIKISKLGHSVASKAFRKSSCESPLKNAVDSDLTNVDADIRMNLSFEKGVGELHVVGDAEMVSEDRTLAVSLQDSAVKFPAVSVNESKCCAVSQNMKSGNVQFQNAEKVTPSLGSCSGNDKIVGDSKPIELQITEKSIQSGRSFDFTMEGLPQAKRRKIEGQLLDASSASPNSKREPFQSIQDTMSTCLNGVEGNSETVLISPYLHISCEEGVDQSNASKSPQEEMDQNMKCYMEEGIKSSSKLQVMEAEHSLEGRDKNVKPSFTFESEQLEPPLVSSLTKRASGDFQGFLVEEAEGEGGTNIIHDMRSQCATEEHQGSLFLDDKLGPEIAENLTCMTERTMWKTNFQLEDGGLFSHCSIGSPHNRYLDLFGADQTRPVFEGFVMQEENEKPHIARDGIGFDKLDLPTTTIERASVLEQLCLSASIHSPLPHFSTTDKLPRAPNFCQSVPNGLLEGMDLQSTLSLNDDAGKLLRASYSCLNEEANHAFQGSSTSDHRPFSSTQFAWNISKPCISPVGKLWRGSTSSSGSSEKRLSLNPELTCFPIEEDPCISEETEQKDDVNDAFHEGISSMTITGSARRELLGDITEEYLNPLASVSTAEKFSDRGSLDSVNIDINVPRTRNKGKEKLQNLYESKTRGTNETRENQSLSVAENGVRRVTESLHNRFSKPKLSGKTSLRKGGPSISERESKHKNIVSNITSFVPLVQRAQGAAVVTGKRDVKVKALEAAEAAKRLEEKRENERKMKKEALKLERARLEQENLRQLELKKKKKEEERKKKEAEMAARKRLREEEEKEKEAKRKRTEEARRQQREHDQKLRAEKEKEKRHRATVEKVHERKEARDELKIDKKVGEDTLVQIPETELRTSRVSTSDISKASIVLKDSEALSDCGEIQKVTGNLDKASENDNLVANTTKEESYEMSPYQSSDDEEEEEDDIPTKKFIPSWARFISPFCHLK